VIGKAEDEAIEASLRAMEEANPKLKGACRARRSRAGEPEALMIRIAITQAAFDAIAKTLALGSVGYENKANEKGERLVWLDRAVVDRLGAMRGLGESYSDVILRLTAEG
jgi:hypothetical protein